MRKIFSFFVIAFISIVGLSAQQTSRIVYFANLIGFDINTEEEIPVRNLSIIYFILDNTQEQHIHCMRGEDHNQVFILPDGRVMVFDRQHHEVTNFNRGSVRIARKGDPLGHYILDTLPWLNFGVDSNDPTSIEERLEAYLKDMQNAIFIFLFHRRNDPIKEVHYSDLTQSEKEVCHTFNQMLFNPSYKIQLTDDNIQKMHRSPNLWSKYCHQIFNLFF